MPNSAKPDDVRDVWQKQDVERMTLSMDEMRRRAARFERRIRMRNVREYVAGAVVIVFFAMEAWREPGWRSVPAWLLIAGTVYIVFQLHWRGGVRPVVDDNGMPATLIRRHREELERQRDALRSIWSWYLAPFVPGLAATMIAAAIEHRINIVWYLCCVAFPLTLAGIWKLNQRAAQRLDRKIEELKAMEP